MFTKIYYKEICIKKLVTRYSQWIKTKKVQCKPRGARRQFFYQSWECISTMTWSLVAQVFQHPALQKRNQFHTGSYSLTKESPLTAGEKMANIIQGPQFSELKRSMSQKRSIFFISVLRFFLFSMNKIYLSSQFSQNSCFQVSDTIYTSIT